MPASPIHSTLRTLSIAALTLLAFTAFTVAAAVLTQLLPDAAQGVRGNSTKAVAVTSVGPRQSGPVAVYANGQRLVNVNPESNTISVFDVTTDTPNKLAEVVVGTDPSSVAVHPDGTRAYVANAFDGTITVVDLNSFGINSTVSVGVEPMAVAVSPNGTRVYVANSASNSLTVFDTNAWPGVIATIDLSAVGTAPRAIAVTNNGDANDADETVFVAMFYGQLRAGKNASHEGQDDQREGRVAAISAATNTVTGTTVLAPMANTGFNSNGTLSPGNGLTPAVASTNPQTFTTPTGAYPNQLLSVAIQPGQNRAYVVSTAASPNGPFRFNHMVQGLVSAFDTSTRAEITAAQTDAGVRRTAPLNLNQGINLSTTPAPKLFMSNPVGMTWRPNGSDAWVAVQNADLVVRLTVDASGVPTISAPLAAGPSSIVRVDLMAVGAGQIQGKAPQGIAINNTGTRAYVFNLISRSITTIDISNGTAPVIVGTATTAHVPLPATAAGVVHRGAELFYTGRGPEERMSSEAWGGCIVCHPKGRSDNVTWMFDAGPRQTIPLDGTFNKLASHDQRILNWSAVRDENQDFELNSRGVFGGRGLIDDDRLFLAVGGSNGATPTDTALIEQFNNFTFAVGTTNGLGAGGALPAVTGARRDFAIATLPDNRVFIIGGRSGAGAGALITGPNAVLEFNPRTNALIARSPVGFTPRHSFGATAVQTSRGPRIYAVGGYASTAASAAPVTTVEEYNPFNNTWRTVASLPTAVAQFGIATAGGVNTAEPLQLVHVVSGNTGSEGTPSLTNANPVQRFQADPTGAGTWTGFAATGLSPRRNHGVATALRGVSSRIFVVGGQDAAGTVLDTVEEYQAQAVTVVASAHTSMPGARARFGIASTLTNNLIYVVGGVDGAGAGQTTVLEYTVANNGAVAGPAGTPSGSWATRGNLSAARSGLQLSNPPGINNFLTSANAGRDADQDAIAKWVATVRPAQPPVSSSSAAAISGKALFNQVGLVVADFSCATCHGGAKYTKSTVGYTGPPSPEVGLGLGNQRVIGAELRQTIAQGPNAGQAPGVLINVGTFLANAAGGRVNEIRANGADASQAIAPLGANGFNIPSLLSVHETAPYYYNGLAQTLDEVLNGSQDGNGGVRHHFVNNSTQRANLISYLKSIGPDTTPLLPAVVEFYNAPLDNFFITADPVEAAAVDSGAAGPGWARTGNVFNSGGPIAVCRFYGSIVPGPNSHFYTASASECAGLIALAGTTPPSAQRWNFESNDFLTNVPANGVCPAQTAPVFRAYNNGFSRHIDSNHRITNNQASITELVPRGWVDEGVVMCAPK